MSLDFACACGTVRWSVDAAGARSGTHTICYCRDCRAWARSLGIGDQLVPGGGLRLFITQPGHMEVTGDTSALVCTRLSPKGLERWSTACCNTPVASHVPGWAPMAGVTAASLPDPSVLGPVRLIYGAKGALPGHDAPTRNRGVKRLMIRLLFSSLWGHVTGRSRRTPFYRDGARPSTATAHR
ncbi:DUF6151 family protein [Pseudaestuariivita atlantica]|uniref:DUF6151 family protein n=1 Tax=Pseudaestuariivita atlantica TaxID=1317121 RepID=UPI00067B477C|nr:DUF6151 family protein [Pseudaestuariivita atlantica]